MSFTSLTFAIMIMICALAGFFVKGNSRRLLLLGVNVLFYLSFGLGQAIYLVLASLVVYFVCEKINEKKLAAVVIGLVIGLVFFKYAPLFAKGLIVPVGISFFRFKLISYAVDKYKGKINEASLMDYLIYISFFAQIVAGPISRFTDFEKELESCDRELSYAELRYGLMRFAMGAFEKVVIADRIGLIVDQVFGSYTDYNGLSFIFAMILYSFQIYADFDGYSNMAIGLGKLFGIGCKENFLRPYMAVNLQDFWRRWHISLSQWFRDYVYIPLGGNRKGELRQYFNVMVVFVLSGLWHGSTIGYALWGFLHGLIQILSRRFLKGYKGNIVVNFIVVTFLWLFFRVQDFGVLSYVLRSLINIGEYGFDLGGFGLGKSEVLVTLVLVGCFIVVDVLREKGQLAKFDQLPLVVRWSLYFGMIVLFVLLGVWGPGYNAADFIYQQL